MTHLRKTMAYGLLFFVCVVLLIGLASGSWHVALHGGVYIAGIFTLWLEARLSR